MLSKQKLLAILGSRLGLQFPPIGSTEMNIGVEQGGEYLYQTLKQDWLQTNRVFSKSFPEPSAINERSYLTNVISYYDQVSLELDKTWRSNERLIALGGDHSISYISINSVLKRFGSENVGIIMFDSHADLHLPETSPTGNFHGMWMRTFFEDFKQAKNQKITPIQLRYIGNLLIEKEEADFIKNHKIRNLTSEQALNSSAQAMLKWAKSFKHLHISFDIDIIQESVSPATGAANPNGFSLEQTLTMLKPLTTHNSWSFDFVELNPLKDKDLRSTKIASKILSEAIN